MVTTRNMLDSSVGSGAKSNKMKDYLKQILYLSGFLDLLGVSMIMPLIQPQLIDMGASPTWAGIVGSVYGGLQLFSSPVVGHWSDSIGRRLCLCVCLVLTACGYFTLGIHQALPMFFIGRFLLGCCKHSQTISRALLALTADEQAKVIGNFNSFSSIGFIIGPICGGHLAESQWGFRCVAFAAALVFLLNAGLILWVVPPDSELNQQGIVHDDVSDEKLKPQEDSLSWGKLTSSFREFDWVELWDLFLIRFLAGFSVIIFRTNFSMVLRQKLLLSPKTVGYITSYCGIVATLSGFLIGKITQRYKSISQLYLHATVLQAVTLLFLSMTSSIHLLVVFLTPLGLSTALSRVTGTTLTIQRSGSKAVGSVMGLSQSTMAIARIASPFLAGVTQEISVDGASYISVAVAVMCLCIMVVRPQDPHRRKLKTS